MKQNFSFRKLVFLLIGIAILALMPFIISSYYMTLMTRAMLLAMFALSFNLLFGYTGLLSFGHAAYFAIGGYVFAYLLSRADWNFLLAMLAGVIAAVSAAAFLGFFAVRRGEIYFAMLTLAFGMMVYTIIFQWREVTNGSDGLTGVFLPTLEWGENRIRIGSFRNYYWVSLVSLVLCAAGLYRITRSHFGEVLQALRENQERAAFSGINLRLHQWQAFVISGFFAGVAGVLFIPYAYVAAPDIAHWSFSAQPVLMTILGGPDVFLGPAVGAFMLVFLESFVTSRTEYWNLLLGIILVPLILFFRGGLLSYSLELLQQFIPRQKTVPATSSAPQSETASPSMVTAKPSNVHSSKVVLELEGVNKHFGMVKAVNEVSLKVTEGTITAIIGPNGAGKTTLYNVLSGRFPASDGTIKLNGADITNLPPYRIAHAGLGRSFQITSVYPRLTVRQNIRIASISHLGVSHNIWHPVHNNQDLNAQIDQIMDLVGMRHRAETQCSELSYGERALTEIGIVLALDPTVILLDEPTSGMSPDETRHIVKLIGELRDKTGKTIVITEHDMEVVFSVAERIIVMHQGRILADGTPEAIQDDPAVREAYLGTSDVD